MFITIFKNTNNNYNCDYKTIYIKWVIKLQADRLAAGFLKIGLDKGDRIGIWAPNMPSWYLTKMAAGRAGLILVIKIVLFERNIK